ncbi:MAG: DinB family protein [Bacteroidota bacterium]
MRKLMIIILALAMYELKAQGTIDQTERSFITSYLQVTFEETKKILESTDDNLWNYQPKDEGWTIGECMEHIVLAEKAVFMQVKAALKGEADQEKSLKRRDGLVISYAVDRGKKVITPLPPESVSMDQMGYLEAFRLSRQEIMSFLANESLELRSHFGKSPFGEVDAYQLILIIAAHGQRHTAQMKEIIGEYSGEPVKY